MDFGLALAVDILDQEKCGKCGTPAWWAFSEDNNIQFEVDEHKCEACAFLDEHESKQKDDDKKFGVTETVKVVHVDWEFGDKDAKLPTRSDWYAELAKKASKSK